MSDQPIEAGAGAQGDLAQDGQSQDGISQDYLAQHDSSASGETDADRASENAMDRLDDGHAMAGVASGPAPADSLPFMMSAREHFAAVADVSATGDARVDAATARLEEIPDLPTADHVSVYEDVHHRLQDTLSEAEVR